MVVFIESLAFTRRLRRLASGKELLVLGRIQEDLQANAERGALVPGLGGIRKARIENVSRGKGKRGGFRYLYLYLRQRQHVHLLLLLDKSEQADLSAKERANLRVLANRIKATEETWRGRER